MNSFKIKQNNTHAFDEKDLLLLSGKVVSKYAYAIPEREREDVKMSIVEKYLIQEEKIISQFKGQSKFSTYCYAILNRICCGIIRQEIKRWQYADESAIEEDSGAISPSESMIIKDEIAFLSRILVGLNDRYKLIVFLAFLYRLEPNSEIISKFDKGFKKHQLIKLLSTSHSNSKAELYATMAKLVNMVENKLVKADAVRMWLNKQRDSVINRLNGPFNRANYDKESFQILFEHFYLK